MIKSRQEKQKIVRKHCYSPSISTRQRIRAKYSKPTECKSYQDTFPVFREVLVLIVSLLHGSLFFVLGDKTIDLINNFSFLKLSFLLFYFSVFFRIFQTHILAAFKYADIWKINPLDFIPVFLSSLFEYLLFMHEHLEIKGYDVYNSLIFIFCGFGLIGYLFTFLKTFSGFSTEVIVQENKIQTINLICIILIALVHFGNYYLGYPNVFLRNIFSTIILYINIFLSISLSKLKGVQQLDLSHRD